MKKIELYYFSGTGNSLHIAKEIQRGIPEVELIPMISLLDQPRIKTDAEVVGMVFPLYLTTIPKPVDDFIEKLDMTSAEYTFSVITRIGYFSVANVYMDRVLKKRGRSLDATFLLNMANNSPTGLKPIANQKWIHEITMEKINVLEDKVQENLKLIIDRILMREKIHSKGTMSLVSRIIEPIMTKITKNQRTEIPFYSDSDCTRCGICENVCPSGKIKRIDSKITWEESVQCYFCYACFNFCPSQSILVGKKYTQKNGRYHHPDVNQDEISAQKLDNGYIMDHFKN